jgi:hypothetical protein
MFTCCSNASLSLEHAARPAEQDQKPASFVPQNVVSLHQELEVRLISSRAALRLLHFTIVLAGLVLLGTLPMFRRFRWY